MNSTVFTELSQFVRYAQKRFHLSWLAGSFGDSRLEPLVPSRAVWQSLMLGEVVKVPSHLQLEAETRLPQWQRWVGYGAPISHDTMGYAADRFDPQ